MEGKNVFREFINPKGVEHSSKCGKVPRVCPWGFSQIISFSRKHKFKIRGGG